jgi:hypothetical protein
MIRIEFFLIRRYFVRLILGGFYSFKDGAAGSRHFHLQGCGIFLRRYGAQIAGLLFIAFVQAFELVALLVQ